MGKYTVMGLIFANMHDSALSELTSRRAMGSVPFGGRYRLIDFPLSNMVNAGISRVGIITKQNYQSLMDHLGSGKAWDLSRKTEGLYMLTASGADAYLLHVTTTPSVAYVTRMDEFDCGVMISASHSPLSALSPSSPVPKRNTLFWRTPMW